MTELTELEQDALTEIFNIGVGIAADALSSLTGEPVPLSVPVVALTCQKSAKRHHSGHATPPLCVVRQTYRGALTTEAILVFPPENNADLVRLMTGAPVSPDALADLASDALAELGNIVLNAVVSHLSSSLRLPLEGSLPEVRMVESAQALIQNSLTVPASGQAEPLLALTVDFELFASRANISLAFLLDRTSTDTLIERLGQYVSGALDRGH